MIRRTKIIASIGPASESPEIIRGMIEAGMNLARIGLAHNSLETSLERFRTVRRVAEEMRENVGILVDLPGPKIRTAPFAGDGATFMWGKTVSLKYGTDKSTAEVIEVDYEDLVDTLSPQDQIGFGDGSVLLSVDEKIEDSLICSVLHGGVMNGRPGVAIPAERLSIPTPTPEDLKMLDAFLEEGLDLVALSFVRSAEDIRRLNLPPHPEGPLVIAKIETHLAVDNLKEIIAASGAVMVARGDLGVHYPLEDVPHLQKRIIQECVANGRPVITATQMMESMIYAPNPTRAEVSDIANAVFDGTSAVMLSAETAVGADPVLVVKTMARVAEKADENFNALKWGQTIVREVGDFAMEERNLVTHAITMAGARVATELDLAALICISGTGLTVRSMARFRPPVPILGFCTDPRVVAQLALSWGVTPFLTEESNSYENRVDTAIKLAVNEGLVASGDLVAILAGLQPFGNSTDVLRLIRVE